MDAHQFPYLGGGSGPGVGGGLYRPHVPPDHHGDKPAPYVHLANEVHIRRFHHGVRRLDGPYQPLGFYHA